MENVSSNLRKLMNKMELDYDFSIMGRFGFRDGGEIVGGMKHWGFRSYYIIKRQQILMRVSILGLTDYSSMSCDPVLGILIFFFLSKIVNIIINTVAINAIVAPK